MSVVRPPESASRREEIVAAAIRIADVEGLEAVSMRRLAEELGIAPMTIYSHIADKDDLLDLMRDEVAQEMLVPEPLPADWREALRAIALRTRDALRAHPWNFDAEPQRPRRRINTMRHIEQSLNVVEMLGVDMRTGGTVLMAVDDYVIGNCIRERARQRLIEAMHGSGEHGREGAAAVTPLDPEVAAAIGAGELARIERLFKRRGTKSPIGVPPETDFKRGLEWLLDGIEETAKA